MNQNKLYILLTLGLSIEYSKQENSTSSSEAWYAGDCLNAITFSSYYGYVDYDCGDECYSTYKGDGDDSSSSSGNTGGGKSNDDKKSELPLCYKDDYGDVAIDKAEECYKYASNCDLAASVDDCKETAYGCYGDETCLTNAICSSDD